MAIKKEEPAYCTTCKKEIKKGSPAVFLKGNDNRKDGKIWFCIKCAKMKRPPEMLSII